MLIEAIEQTERAVEDMLFAANRGTISSSRRSISGSRVEVMLFADNRGTPSSPRSVSH